MQSLPLDYLLLSENKLREMSPNGQLNLDNYKMQVKRDRDKNDASLTEFVGRYRKINGSLLICGFVSAYVDLKILVIFQ